MQKQFERTQTEWSIWLWWVLASTVGGAVAAVVFVVGAYAGVVGFPVGGAVVGVFQWLVLRGKISQAGWWVLASSVGWTVGGAAGLLAGFLVAEAVSGFVAGAVAGALQWLVLRGKISQAGWWVLASSVGFAVTDVVNLLVAGFAVFWLVGWAVQGATAGCITGGALVWLLQQPRSEMKTTEAEDQLSPASAEAKKERFVE